MTHTIPCVVVLTLVLGPVAPWSLQDMLADRDYRSDELAFCNQTLSTRTASIFVTDDQVRSNRASCFLHVSVFNATSLHVLFLPLPPGLETLPGTALSPGADVTPSVSVYTSDPWTSGAGPQFFWVFQKHRIVQSFASPDLWFLFHPPGNPGSVFDQNSTSSLFSISYASRTPGESEPSCRQSGPPAQVQQGAFEVSDVSLGSAAVLTCDLGYFVPDGFPPVSLCIPADAGDNGTAAVWSGPPFLCESVCERPPQVEHASVHKTFDTDIRYVPARDGSGFRVAVPSTNSTAMYTCDAPYVMFPRDHPGLLACATSGSTATSSPPPAASLPPAVRQTSAAPTVDGGQLDTRGASSWWQPSPPSCVIPDCSTTITLTHQAGAIVNPSYPGPTLTGGRKLCRWRITAPFTSNIRVSVVYTDLPAPDQDTNVVVYDAGAARPYQMLRLSGQQPSRGQSATSSSSLVTVTYIGPSSVTSGHRGFYLTYEMRPRIRQPREAENGTAVVVAPGNAPAAGETGSDADNYSVDNDSAPTKPPAGLNQKSSGDNSSVDTSIIAIGVVVPLVALALILVGGYFWYRRKYPVRMIIGRDVAKFTNPKYARPNPHATLVRDDADDFFNRDGIDGVMSLEMNPVNPRWQEYDNLGFQRDEAGAHFDDEEEEERRFREKKSWLFRRSEDKGVSDAGKRRQSKAETSSVRRGSRSSVELGDRARQRSLGGESSSTDISELLGEQSVTPHAPRRKKGKGHTRESSSNTGSEHSVTAAHVETHATLEDGEPGHSSTSAERNSDESRSGEQQEGDQESNFMKTAKVIFEQPTFEEVVAEVKARSRSMSLGNVILDQTIRPRSFSVDPSKSARKMSLHDETVLAVYAKSLQAAHITEMSASSDSSALNHSAQLALEGSNPRLSASIVGVDIQVKSVSSTSIGSCGSSISVESEDDQVNTPERMRGLSLASTNSNPHLVTDLDESSESEVLPEQQKQHQKQEEEGLPEQQRQKQQQHKQQQEEKEIPEQQQRQRQLQIEVQYQNKQQQETRQREEQQHQNMAQPHSDEAVDTEVDDSIDFNSGVLASGTASERACNNVREDSIDSYNDDVFTEELEGAELVETSDIDYVDGAQTDTGKIPGPVDEDSKHFAAEAQEPVVEDLIVEEVSKPSLSKDGGADVFSLTFDDTSQSGKSQLAVDNEETTAVSQAEVLSEAELKHDSESDESSPIKRVSFEPEPFIVVEPAVADNTETKDELAKPAQDTTLVQFQGPTVESGKCEPRGEASSGEYDLCSDVSSGSDSGESFVHTEAWEGEPQPAEVGGTVVEQAPVKTVELVPDQEEGNSQVNTGAEGTPQRRSIKVGFVGVEETGTASSESEESASEASSDSDQTGSEEGGTEASYDFGDATESEDDEKTSSGSGEEGADSSEDVEGVKGQGQGAKAQGQGSDLGKGEVEERLAVESEESEDQELRSWEREGVSAEGLVATAVGATATVDLRPSGLGIDNQPIQDNIFAENSQESPEASKPCGAQDTLSAPSPTPNAGLDFSTQAPQKRVKIQPLVVDLSDDDDDDDEEEGGGYKLSDSDISDILASSDDEDRDGGKRGTPRVTFGTSSPTTYTFQDENSDDDDIDV